MNNEIKTPTNELRSPEIENYRSIRPDGEINLREANAFWRNEFVDVSQEMLAKTKEINEFDDNGVRFRDGDKLIPNTSYEVNGYQYETDGSGRIVSAEGTLHMRDADYVRDMEPVRNKEGQEYLQTDERGHLIAHQFGGSDKLENLVPMDAHLNKGDFAKLENTLAEAVKDGAEVYLKVEPVYEGQSSRPVEFRVAYTIDGEKDVVVFRNEGVERYDK